MTGLQIVQNYSESIFAFGDLCPTKIEIRKNIFRLIERLAKLVKLCGKIQIQSPNVQ